MKALTQKDSASPCSTATLYTIAKIWEQPKRPSVNEWIGNSLAFQWLRIRQPIQGTQVQSLVQEDPIHHRATKPTCCNYSGPTCLDPVLCIKGRHCNKKPAHHNKEQPLLTTMRESLHTAKTQPSQKQKSHISKREKGQMDKETVVIHTQRNII